MAKLVAGLLLVPGAFGMGGSFSGVDLATADLSGIKCSDMLFPDAGAAVGWAKSLACQCHTSSAEPNGQMFSITPDCER